MLLDATGTDQYHDAERHVILKTPNVGMAFTLFPPRPGEL